MGLRVWGLRFRKRAHELLSRVWCLGFRVRGLMGSGFKRVEGCPVELAVYYCTD